MTDRVALAARNNAHWVDAVCRAHGLVGTMDESLWSSPRRTPPYYPDAVTLSPDVGEYDLLARIDASDGASVKDSWSCLDLSVEGFARLVEGQWLWRDPTDEALRTDPALRTDRATQTDRATRIDRATQTDRATRTDQATRTAEASGTWPTGDGRTWRRVTSVGEHSTWVGRWAQDPRDALILPAALLDEPGVHFLAAEDGGDRFAAGCIVNVADGVAGLGNLFSSDGDDARAWLGAVSAAAALAPDLPLVGWEAGEGLESAGAAGCEAIGPLTVWIR